MIRRRWASHALAGSTVVAVLLCSARAQAQWVNNDPLPSPLAQTVVVTADSGHIYIFGGYTTGGTVVDTTYEYDPAAGTYTPRASMPSATRGACGGRAGDGRLVVVGGTSGFLGVTRVYDPTSNTWTTGASGAALSAAGWECAAVSGSDGLIHVFGGESDPTNYSVYDAAADSWAARPDMPTNRKQHGAVEGSDGNFYVFGGDESKSTMDRYNTSSGTWTASVALPGDRQSFAYMADDSGFYIVGGSTSYGNNASPYFATTWRFDIATQTWDTSLPALVVAARELEGAREGFMLHVFGGSNGTQISNHQELAIAGCGNSQVDPGEDCDDGNADNTDACLDDCTDASCGDGFVWSGNEECDNGTNNSDTAPDACRTSCEDASCGDDVVDTGEECDDGTGNSDTAPDACRTGCEDASCGDGVVDTGEECDDGTGNSDVTADACRTVCVDPACGDGVPDTGEQCDDGNTTSGDGCSATCTTEGTGGTGGTGATGGTGGTGATGGTGTTGGSGTTPDDDTESDSGCGCRIPGQGSAPASPLPLAFGLGTLLALVRRRRP